MKPQHALAALASCGLLLVLAFWSWPQPETTQVGKAAEGTAAGEAYDVDANGVSDDSSVAKSSMATQTRAARKVLPETPSLPAFDTPFKDSFDALLEATRNGNKQAACRLIGETRRCQTAKSRLPRLKVPTPPKPSLPPPDEADQVVIAKAELQTVEDQLNYQRNLTRYQLIKKTAEDCGDIDTSSDRLAEFRIIAAATGDITSQLNYARGGHLKASLLLRRPELLGQYRLHARNYFTQALEAGNLGTIEALWEASLPMYDSPLASYLPPAWKEPGFVAALMERMTEAQFDTVFREGSVSRLATTPTPQQVDSAKDMYERYFANTPAGKPRYKIPPNSSDGALEFERLGLNRDLNQCDIEPALLDN